MTTFPARLILACGTAAAWTDANPVLLEGEMGYETDTHAFKVGDGIKSYVDLPYADPAGSSAVELAKAWAIKDGADGTVEGDDYSAKANALWAQETQQEILASYAAWESRLASAEQTFALFGNFFKVVGTAPNQEIYMFTGNPASPDVNRPRYRFAVDGKMYYKPVGGTEIVVILDNGVDRQTAAQWTAANAILAASRFGVETDTGKVKIGDGVTVWNSLAYISAAIAGNEIDGGSATSNYPLP